jgi:hypothetical protein
LFFNDVQALPDYSGEAPGVVALPDAARAPCSLAAQDVAPDVVVA